MNYLVLALATTPLSVAEVNVWTKEIRAGVTYRHEYIPDAPLSIHSIRVKVPSSAISLKPALGNGALLAGSGEITRSKVSSIAAAHSAFVAVNGDFFSPNGDPIGLFVRDGEMLSDPFPNRSALGWSDSNVLIGAPEWSAVLLPPSGGRLRIDGINRTAGKNDVVLVTESGGRALASEDALMLVFDSAGVLTPTCDLEAKFRFVIPDVREIPVRAQQWVIVATGARRAQLLVGLQQNSLFRIRASLSPGTEWDRVTNAIGGGPRLMTNGAIDVRANAERFDTDFANVRHPRTAIGIAQNGDLLFVVVDGRSQSSRGATLGELAGIMRRLGCRDAINLDGGGSSTLFALGLVLNAPSDGEERPVANALLLLGSPASQPGGAVLEIRAPTGDLYPGDARQLSIADPSGAPVDPTTVVWSLSGKSGRVDQSGKLTALSPGKVIVRAVSRGSFARAEFTILPKPVPPPPGT
jgi:hypothetical protein